LSNHKFRWGMFIASLLCWASLAQPRGIRLLQPETSPPEKQDASAETELQELEHQVDNAILKGDTTFLQTVFADDYRFLHADGSVTNKTESLQQVAKRPYILRHLDAVNIELHGDVALTDGLVDVNARGEHGTRNHSYLVRYVRVYQHRNGRWVMLMQNSVGETTSMPFDVPSPK
jgi:ketosteroid isomerase-like protein